jgi:DNA-binding NtrC family response regulator
VGAKEMNVFSVGTDWELLWLRDAVLRTAGFNVFTTSDKQQVQQKIQNGEYGVLLMCHSTPKGTREHLAQIFRESCPDGKIIAITNENIKEVPAFADDLVYGMEGPEALIDAVRQVKKMAPRAS